MMHVPLKLSVQLSDNGFHKSDSASVVADSTTIAYRLTRASLSRMKEQNPTLAATFHEFIARTLSERLKATTRTLEAVLK